MTFGHLDRQTDDQGNFYIPPNTLYKPTKYKSLQNFICMSKT